MNEQPAFCMICGGQHPCAAHTFTFKFTPPREHQLATALVKLVNELRGTMGAFEFEMREAIGNTNFVVLEHWMVNADEVLAGRAPQAREGTPQPEDTKSERGKV